MRRGSDKPAGTGNDREGRHSGARLIGIDAAGAVESLCPVAVTQILDADAAAAARSVDKLVVAEIDADMGKGVAHGVEEDQIAGAEFVAADFLSGAAHFLRTARQYQSEPFAENVADETGTVEAGLGGTAAATIADAEQIHGLIDGILRRRRGAVDERHLQRRRNHDRFVGTGREGQKQAGEKKNSRQAEAFIWHGGGLCLVLPCL